MPAFVTQKLVRFQHCDPAGVVFYPQYFLMFNEVVEDWFQDGLGISMRKLHLDDGMGIPVRRTTCEFLAVSMVGDTLDCGLTVDKVGGSSLAITIRVSCAGEVRAVVNHVLVHLSMKAKKPVAFSDEVREKLLRFAA